MAWGEVVGENRVARLMHKAQLQARHKRRRWPVDAGMRLEHCIASHSSERQFVADGPNRKWAADFTYLWTAQGWLYVAVVIDLYSRKVVGWSISASMTSALVIDALTMAVWRRGKPTQLLHHSDQGGSTRAELQRLLADQGIACSMSRKGDCWTTRQSRSFRRAPRFSTASI